MALKVRHILFLPYNYVKCLEKKWSLKESSVLKVMELEKDKVNRLCGHLIVQ